VPRFVAFLGQQLAPPDAQCLGSHLYVGKLCFAQITKPVRVPWGAGGSTPHKEAFTGIEVAHASGVQNAGSAPGRCDHQDRHALVGACKSTVGNSIHPDADPVPDAHQSVLEGSHRLLQRRHQAHDVVNIALAPWPAYPLGQGQFATH
jgi:hypothetical protein